MPAAKRTPKSNPRVDAAKAETRKAALAAVAKSGRITRPDQAYAVAVKENDERNAEVQGASRSDAQAVAEDRAPTALTVVKPSEYTDHTHVADCSKRHNPDAVCSCEFHRAVSQLEDEGLDRGEAEARIAAQKPALAQLQLVASNEPTANLPAVPSFALPVRLLSTALLCAAKGDVRYYLNGVYLHAVEGEVRVVGTDGHRMIVSRYIPEDPIPEWLTKGIILPRDDVAAILPILLRNGTVQGLAGPDAFTHGNVLIEATSERATLRSYNGFATFSVRLVDGVYPDYQQPLAGLSEVLSRSAEGQPLETAAINTSYLRSAADIGKMLGAASIHSFVGAPDKPVLFTFAEKLADASDVKSDTILIVMPVRGAAAVSPGAMKLLGEKALAGSLAALRAHLTRTDNALRDETGPMERKQLEDKRASFESRIAAIVEQINSTPALPAPGKVAA